MEGLKIIIQFPTGLYRTVLPQKPGDSGNVTYVISNNPPPRTDLLFPKMPRGIEVKRKKPRSIEPLRRREVIGDLAFTISKSSRTEEGNNAKQFEIGQILEFSDAPLKRLDPMLVARTTQVQHDVNRLDYDAMGVADEERRLIAETSLLVQKSLSERLNDIRQRRANAEERTLSNQKIINDINRTMNALQVVADSLDETDNDVQDLLDKLIAKRDVAFEDRDAAVDEANQLAEEATRLVNEIRAVSTVLD